MSFDTVRHWKNKFESGEESIKNVPKSGRPKFVSPKEIVSKIKEIIEGDSRFTVRDIARKVGIPLSTVQLILKKLLKVRKIFARWVPHLLTDEQNRQRVKVAQKLLHMFPTCDKEQFANVITDVFYFEHVRKVSKKIWATKHSKRPIVVKRSLSAMYVWYAIFFTGEGVAIKVPVEKGKKHHRKVLQRQSTGEAKKILSETTPCHWFQTYPSSTWQCPSSYLPNNYGVFEEKKSNFFCLTYRIL